MSPGIASMPITRGYYHIGSDQGNPIGDRPKPKPIRRVKTYVTRLAAAPFLWAGIALAQTPSITPGGIVNSASYATNGVAPGSIVSIFGSNLARQTFLASSVPLPTTLDNVMSVTFNGVPAPLYYVSTGQINVQVPWNLPSRAVNVVVTTTAGPSTPQSVQVMPAVPGIFAVSSIT